MKMREAGPARSTAIAVGLVVGLLTFLSGCSDEAGKPSPPGSGAGGEAGSGAGGEAGSGAGGGGSSVGRFDEGRFDDATFGD